MPLPNRAHEHQPITVTWTDTGPAEPPYISMINGRVATEHDREAYVRAVLDGRKAAAELLAGVLGTEGMRP
jgi:DNA polymerase IIIc chi subunit